MSTPIVSDLVLDRLKEGLTGISPTGGAALVEACLVCLHYQKHASEVIITVDGAFSRSFLVRWQPEEVTEQICRFWNDMDRTAEWGAECIACLLVLEFTDFTIIERSRKKTGFDYWLGYDEEAPLFERKGRLEVSGILRGKESDIKRRTRQKILQTARSDSLKLPVYAVVVEFSRPWAQVATK